MNVEKFTSNKAAVECRYNPMQERWRVHIAVGKRRVGPLSVRVPDDTDEAKAADEAARIALSRAITRNLVGVADVEHEDGVPIVHADDGKHKAPASKMKAPAPSGAAPVERKVAQKATKPKPPASPMGEEKASAIIGNVAETHALEELYENAKDEYHEVGEALKERHLAVAAISAAPR